MSPRAQSRGCNDNFDMLKILSECRNATHYKYNPKN
jgi:hypothetical protein